MPLPILKDKGGGELQFMRIRVIYGIDFFYMGKHLVKVYNPNARTPVKIAVNMSLPIRLSVPGNLYMMCLLT